ncbi:SRPBCC family protein [Actinomadura algeriensis]|uniref:Membrane protein n=1 Tax=Actinomadura algeriensis TaxID=1679523 RepID=A0ABR9JVT8_9ACTN|nr:SRPBCC family protein [Actinomadura algeriensis]MBE1534679.1 putative membrane protein [Actinomadura algeriensis]
MPGTKTKDAPGPTDDLPLDQFKKASQDLARAAMTRALSNANSRIRDLTGRLGETAGDGGGTGAKMFAAGAGEIAKGKSPLRAGLSAGMTGAKEKAKDVAHLGGGGGGGGEKEAKVVNIVEEFDVGLPLRTAYDQWTRFGDYPSFTSKVESVEQESDEKINWRAQIFLSHRSWESTIVEQIPDTRIVWKSEGAKGYVDGAVTFAELTPNLTRVLLVAEYHPDGFFEKTANLWRAQGRRLRLEFKHIKRHMMTHAVLEQGEIGGWRGEIRDGEVVKTHEDAVKEEQEAREGDSGERDGD